MKYKGIFLDIDNTLYDYDRVHVIAKNAVIQHCAEKFKIGNKTIEDAYETGRKKVHIDLKETAASHNRLLYFQKMLEILSINPLRYSLEIYNIYWDTFLSKLVIFEGVNELLEKYKNRICLLTDLTAHIQYKKIHKLQLESFVKCIVTSEEAGKEKPHPFMFMLALQKMDLKPNDVCMVGDSFKKDIIGATNLDIDSIWLNRKNKKEIYQDKKICEVYKFSDILELV